MMEVTGYFGGSLLFAKVNFKNVSRETLILLTFYTKSKLSPK